MIIATFARTPACLLQSRYRAIEIYGELDLKRSPARAKSVHEDETYFLNVDLDVFGRSSLEPLASAFGSKVSQLYVGPRGNHYSAHFELRASPRAGADALIVSLVQLVKRLPRAARLAWNQAYRRDFNIEILGGLKPRSYELILNPETLKSVSSVNARIVVCIYGSELPFTPSVNSHSRNRLSTEKPVQRRSGRPR
jgi:hypothetical protein